MAEDEPERRFAAIAAFGLFVSMFLPWYQQNGVVKAGSLESRNLDAFQVFSFVEAAVLLVAIALLYMLYARADGRDFRLPGGDGTIVLLAGLWVGALLIFRLFDKPGISSHGVAGNVGVQWGIFFALAAAGLIAYSGSRMRGLHAGPDWLCPAPAAIRRRSGANARAASARGGPEPEAGASARRRPPERRSGRRAHARPSAPRRRRPVSCPAGIPRRPRRPGTRPSALPARARRAGAAVLRGRSRGGRPALAQGRSRGSGRLSLPGQ